MKQFAAITEGTSVRGPISLGDEVIFPADAQWHVDQIDGPIKWRDTIVELEARAEDIQREIASLHARLTEEGFSLIRQYPSASTDSPVSLPYSQWQAGDFVISKVDYNKQFTKGKKYKVTSTHVSLCENRISVEEDDKGVANGWLANQFEFHSRP